VRAYTVEQPAGAFSEARERFEGMVAWLGGDEAAELTHEALEARLAREGRDVLRQLMQDHLALRAVREKRLDEVVGADGARRGNVEGGHARGLATVFGEVTVARKAYRAPGHGNLHPLDAALNLPAEKHSHGMRRLAAEESARGSFAEAAKATERATGCTLGKRQVRQLAERTAVDFDAFYAWRRPHLSATDDVLVLTCDGKGIVMRPEALRRATRQAAARATTKLQTRLSKGEKRHRKRMAEVGAVYDCAPVVRTPEDVLARAEDGGGRRRKRPKARGKWLTASVVDDARTVVAKLFDEAQRRDPQQRRPWVVLVDGHSHQLDCIHAEAAARGLKVHIVLDFVHVLEYLWGAAWCFFKEGSPDAETWVHTQATKILHGRSSHVAAAIRRKATCRHLKPSQRKNADTCARYLMNKRPYLDYATALANGWPIATGVIEGACRHLVKDRMAITGARWSLPGAEAILKLRALRSNGDFDDYWRFHLRQEYQRVHASRYAHNQPPRPS